MTDAVEKVIAGDVRSVARLIRDIDDRVPEGRGQLIEGGEFERAVKVILALKIDPYTASGSLAFSRLDGKEIKRNFGRTN